MENLNDCIRKRLEKIKKTIYLESFTNTKHHFKNDNNFTRNKLDMITRKGVCPYDYLDSFEKFEETCLPPKSAFYSKLNECNIKDSEYKFAQQMWKKFDCKTMKDYLELYLKTDVLCQADVFET